MMQTNVVKSIAIACCCALAGCASLGSNLLAGSEDSVASAPLGQPTAAVVRTGIQTVVTEAKLKPPVQATRLHRSPPSSVDPWMACVRSGATPTSKRLTYAVYFTQAAYARSRLSTLADECNGDVFAAFK